MPLYEFTCAACSQQFEVRASMEKRQAGLAPRCPSCGSVRTKQVLSAPMLLRRGPAGAAFPRCKPGGGCCGS